MKIRTLGLLAPLAMALVGATVYAVTPAGRFATSPELAAGASPSSSAATDPRGSGARPGEASLTQFSTGSTLKLEGRVGHAALVAGAPEETFLLLEVTGADVSGGASSQVALSIVIDKSGSMRGTRIANALAAASAAVDRLQDGDSVSVHAFDTRVETVVPLTTISPASRDAAVRSIRSIQLGGDTCVSCGVEEGLAELRRLGAPGASSGFVQRMLVLSDGDANNGVRDVAGFRAIAQRALAQGVSVSTIGVDLDFNEDILGALAQGSNGRHHFVESDRDLARVFEEEAASLKQSVAGSATAEIELAQGVELVQVFDRTFSRAGSRISVPLGSFSRGERKTVLVKVRVPKGDVGSVPLAQVTLGYRDLLDQRDVTERGALGVELVPDASAAKELDAIVLDRVQRSETAAALRDANSLFSLGKSEEARRRLLDQKNKVDAARGEAKAKAPASRAKDVDSSLGSQQAELERAADGFATPPAGAAPAPTTANKSRKQNVESANAFGF